MYGVYNFKVRIVLGARSKSFADYKPNYFRRLFLLEDRGEISGTFLLTPYLLLIGGRGRIKMASASTPIVMSQRASFYHTEKLKPKGPIARKLVSSGISHVAFVQYYWEKTRLKKLMIMIIIIIITEKPFTSK